MNKITYEDAVELLLDIDDDYRDYVLTEDNALIGGEVGREIILENLFRHKDELEISDSGFFKFGTAEWSMCLGLTYIENYDDNRNQRMFIPIDFDKLTNYLKTQPAKN